MSNHTIVIPAADLETATAFYRTAWGAEPHTETPYYVGFNLDGQEIGLNPNGEGDRMTGPVRSSTASARGCRPGSGLLRQK